MTGYEIYTQWCKDHGQEPPSKEWWDAACAKPSDWRTRDADQREIDRERREGWAYD